MLNCFTRSPEQPIIPIIPILEEQLTHWISQQNELLKTYLNSLGFSAKSGVSVLLCDTNGRLEKVLVGMGRRLDPLLFGQLALSLPKGCYKLATLEANAAWHYQAYLAWGLGKYQFTRYKKAPIIPDSKLFIPDHSIDTKHLEAVITATFQVRDLINTPAVDMMPVDLAATLKQVASEFDATFTQLIGEDLLKENYPLIYAVGKGSAQAPRLLDLRWGKAKHPKITLVGKGVCFDSGGLDLKNAANMALMKKDMAGAAHVIGLARIIMSLQLPVCLRVLVPAVENAVSGNSYRPGDVLMSRAGLTVEVTNTDAEGRLVLADALAEAVSENPDLLLNFCTLTGAARVALGTDIAALFTRDDELAQALINSGIEENDPLWRLPLYAPYKRLIDSKIADISNSAATPYGGAITAALFLKEFVPDEISWAHIDMMAWNNTSRPALPEGGEATALRAVANYLCKKYGA